MLPSPVTPLLSWSIYNIPSTLLKSPVSDTSLSINKEEFGESVAMLIISPVDIEFAVISITLPLWFDASIFKAFWSVSSLSISKAGAPVEDVFSISTPAPVVLIKPTASKLIAAAESKVILPSAAISKWARAPEASTVVKVVAPFVVVSIVK